MCANTVCVAIMDEDNWTSRTDILVVVDAARRRLTWIPRDLYAPGIDNRINRAFARGQLQPALAELGFPCDGFLCLRRGATIAALANVEVEVPVERPLDFWYPLEPLRPIEEGRKQVSFRPPSERLSGERLHQWIGARYGVNRETSDLDRLRRQTVLLRALLARHADFTAVLADAGLYRIEGNDPLPVLVQVTAGWDMRVFDRVHSERKRSMLLLVKSTWPRYLLDRAKTAAAQTLGRR